MDVEKNPGFAEHKERRCVPRGRSTGRDIDIDIDIFLL